MTIWRNDKIPYGVSFAYDHLKSVFPHAGVVVNSKRPAYFSYDENNADSNGKNREAYIIVNTRFIPDSDDINALINYVSHGNQIFISSFRIGDSLLAKLKLSEEFLRWDSTAPATDSVIRLVQPVTKDSLPFTYPGYLSAAYFNKIDSQYCNVLGWNTYGRPDFIGIRYNGGGAIYLSLNPYSLTNFFLVHKNNRRYYESALSYLSPTIETVRWDDYFRHFHYRNFSSFDFLLKNRALNWALWLLIALFALIFLFESKRRQREIPIIPPLANSSVEFVRTIGRLYYQQKNNRNLADKMIVFFMEQVRSKYRLAGTTPDDQFASRLAAKSGFGRDTVDQLMNSMHAVQQNASPSDADLMNLQKQMEIFYKK